METPRPSTIASAARWRRTRDMYLDAQGNVVKGLSTDGYLAVGRARHGGRPRARAQAPRQTEMGGARRAGAQAGGRRLRGQLPPRAQPARQQHDREDEARSPRAAASSSATAASTSMGETFVQPELAAVLARIKSNPRDFYEGETARLIAADMKANGGIITLEDLRTYEPTIRTAAADDLSRPRDPDHAAAVVGRHRPHRDAEHARGVRPQVDAAGTPRSTSHTLVEAMRRAFADRAAVPRRHGFREGAGRRRSPSATYADRAAAQTSIRSSASPSRDVGAGNPARVRVAGDDALHDRRRRRERRHRTPTRSTTATAPA